MASSFSVTDSSSGEQNSKSKPVNSNAQHQDKQEPTNGMTNMADTTSKSVHSDIQSHHSPPATSARARYEKIVRKYYYQLVIGCQDQNCDFKLCFSCSSSPKLTRDAAAMMSMQLATKSRRYFCPRIPEEPDVSLSHSTHSSSSNPTPQNFESPNSTPKPFRKSVTDLLLQQGIATPSTHYTKKSEAEDKQEPLIPSLHPKSQSKPFLHQLLSSSTFTSLFGSNESLNEVNQNSTHVKERHDTHLSDSNDSSIQIETYPLKEKINGSKNIFSFGLGLINLFSLSDTSTKKINEMETKLKENGFDSSQTELIVEPMRTKDIQEDEDNDEEVGSDYSDPSEFLSKQSLQRKSVIHIETEESSSENNKTGSNSNMPSIQYDFLNLERVKELVENVRHASEKEPLETLLSTIKFVFSSSEALNKSFLDEEETHISGLNIPSIRSAYIQLLSLSSHQEQIVRTLLNATEVLLAKLHLNLKRLFQTPAKFQRQYMIILENPLLYDQPTNNALLKKLSLILGNLHGHAKNVLIEWLSKYDLMGFSKTIDLFQNFVSEYFMSKDEEGIVSALKFLSLMYKSNFKHRSHDPIVPMSRFYNESLMKKINFKEEYKNWKRYIQGSDRNRNKSSSTSASNLNSSHHNKTDHTNDGRNSPTRSKAPSLTHPEPLGSCPSTFSYFQYPFLFDPVAKTRILHIDAMVQMSQEFEDAFVNQALVVHAQKFLPDSESAFGFEKTTKQATNPYLVLEVRRQHLMEDTLDQLKKKQADLKKPFKVKFVGGGEEGMDQGGVQKEFFQVIINLLLDPAYGMFVYDEETRLCWINGASLESLNHFELVGMVLGLALYNGVMLDLNFPRLMYKKLLGEKIGLLDVQQAFPSLGKGLEQLLTWEEGDVSDIFMRTFEISYDVYGKVISFPLVEDGENIMVTNQNRKQYVDLYLKHLTSVSVRKQFQAFQKGFLKVVGGQALYLCQAEELELLIVGSHTTELDFTDLEKACEYDDGYHAEHQVIQWFWDIVHHDMSFEQKKMLLNFVTASDRVPLRGLGKLTFVIQRNGPDTDRLPTALTCFGRLLLPEYDSRDKLSNRLITAIENAKGFGLV